MVLAQRPNPAPAQKNPIAITNATIHTATGTVLNNASIVLKTEKSPDLMESFRVMQKSSMPKINTFIQVLFW